MRKLFVTLLFLLLFLVPALPAEAGVGQQGHVRRVNDSGQAVKSVVFTVDSGHAALPGNTGGTWSLKSTTITLNSVIADGQGGTKPFNQSATFQGNEIPWNGELTFKTEKLISHGFTGTANDITTAVNLGGNDAFNMTSVLSVKLANGKTLTVSSIAEIDALPDYVHGGFSDRAKANMKTFFGYAGDPRDDTVVDLQASILTISGTGGSYSHTEDGILSGNSKLLVGQYTVKGVFSFAPQSKVVEGNADVYLKRNGQSYPSYNISMVLNTSQSWSNIEIREGVNEFIVSINAQSDDGVNPRSTQDYKANNGKTYTEPNYQNNILKVRIMGIKEESTGQQPGQPEQPEQPKPTSEPGNLCIYNAEIINKQKLKFKLNSTFNEAGDVKIRIQKYIKYTGDTQWSTSGSEESFNTKMEANQTGKEMERDINMGNGTYKFEVSVNYNIKTKTGEKFKGIHDEITYADNITDTTDSQSMPITELPTVVGGNYRTGKLYYPVFKTKPDELHNITKVNREPIYGWKEYSVKDAKKPRQKIRLVE